jgi:hypothetical protein
MRVQGTTRSENRRWSGSADSDVCSSGFCSSGFAAVPIMNLAGRLIPPTMRQQPEGLPHTSSSVLSSTASSSCADSDQTDTHGRRPRAATEATGAASALPALRCLRCLPVRAHGVCRSHSCESDRRGLGERSMVDMVTVLATTALLRRPPSLCRCRC